MYVSTEAGLIHQVQWQVPSTLGTQQQKDQAGNSELKCVWHTHSSGSETAEVWTQSLLEIISYYVSSASNWLAA